MLSIGFILRLDAQEKKRLSFDQIFKNAEPRITKPLPNIGGWADDGHYLETKKMDGEDHPKVWSVDAKSGKEKLYRDLREYKSLMPDGIDPLEYDSETENGSRLAYLKGDKLYILDTEMKQCRQLTGGGGTIKNPTLSPDGTSVAFTRGNNLYAIETGTGKEHQLTTDGSDVVYNGWASWLYYEEIFGRASRYRAFWWSPDSKQIAFYRFDDSPVPVFPIFNSSGVLGSLENTRYPKAGDPNPTIRIGIVAASGGRVTLAVFDEKADQYFGMPFWTPDGKSLLVQWMNRRQDTLRIFAVSPVSGVKKEVYVESQASWVEWFESITFLKDGGFILKTDKDGWSHLYRFASGGEPVNRVTGGPWSVAGLVAVNEQSGRVFFTAKKEASTRIDLYSVSLDGKDLKRLTIGDNYNTINASQHGSYFITTYSNVSTPPRMALYSSNAGFLRELGDSRTPDFAGFERAKTEMFTIRTADGYNLPAVWTLPQPFDPAKKYPVLMSEYGGPNAQTVWDSWGGIRGEWLAQEGVIQLSVDHRGAGHFGKAGTAVMYRNLGKWEMNDYIEAVRWLRRLPFVDSTRICITGGSYGGYVTCLALTEGAGYFTYGVAEFSVTDWRLYDSHYTERYMDSPANNPEGYRNGSVMTYAGQYRGMLEIIHGTTDDNVHLQNSLQLIDTLEDLNKDFKMMLYPDGRHGWSGPRAYHLRNETYRFYYEYLIRKEFPEGLLLSARNQGEGRPRRGR